MTGKRHLKSIAAPRTWNIERKATTFVLRPRPGSATLANGMPLSMVLRSLVKAAHTAKEARKILHDTIVRVNGKRQQDKKFAVGFLDVIQLEDGTAFRVVFDSKGQLTATPIPAAEAAWKLCTIRTKKTIAGSTVQLSCTDGRTIRLPAGETASYRCGDTLLLQLPEQKILQCLSLAPDMRIVLVGGKYRGMSGMITAVHDRNITFTQEAMRGAAHTHMETPKAYAVALGKEKLFITATGEASR